MKLKLVYFATIGALLLAGFGCVGRGPQPQAPEAAVPAPAVTTAPDVGIDDTVDELIKDIEAEEAAVGDETGDAASIDGANSEINAFYETSYDIQE